MVEHSEQQNNQISSFEEKLENQEQQIEITKEYTNDISKSPQRQSQANDEKTHFQCKQDLKEAKSKLKIMGQDLNSLSEKYNRLSQDHQNVQ